MMSKQLSCTDAFISAIEQAVNTRVMSTPENIKQPNMVLKATFRSGRVLSIPVYFASIGMYTVEFIVDKTYYRINLHHYPQAIPFNLSDKVLKCFTFIQQDGGD